MTFTYAGTLATDLDKIRFRINDTTANAGVKPNGGNFTDEEIAGVLALEGGSVNRAIANLYETLAAVWSNYVDTQVGARKEQLSQVSQSYHKLAMKWRDDYGYVEENNLVTGFATRVDGYSDDIDFGVT